MAGRPYDYVALTTIYYGGSRAYNPGDPVPAANVEKHGYKVGEQVAEYGSHDAERVTAKPAPRPPEETDDSDEPDEPLVKQQPATPKPSPKPSPKRAKADDDAMA